MVESTRRIFNDLMGTGGNVGKRDLAKVWKASKTLTSKPQARAWLRHSCFGGEVELPKLVGGGTWFVFSNKTFNSGQSWFREGRLSPWSFLLATEGAFLLRGAVHHRLGTTAKGKAVFPFLSRSIEPRNDGQVAHAKAEFWAPLWQKFASLYEIEWMLRQGRAEVGGRLAIAPHEFAVAALDAAVDEGLPAFARFELCQTTSAQVYEALPQEHVHVANDTKANREYSRLLLPLIKSRWIDRLPWEPKRADQRGRFVGLRGPVEAEIVHIAEAPEDPERWRTFLLLLARTQHRIDQNKSLREKCPPVPLLHPIWFDQAWPEPPVELRIARAIASIGCLPANSRLLLNIFGVESRGNRLYFPKARPTRTVWHEGQPIDAMVAVFRRRLIDAGDTEGTPLDGSYPCHINDIATFLEGADMIDDELIARWIPALTLLDWSRGARRQSTVNSSTFPLNRFYTLLRPLFVPHRTIVKNRSLFPRSGGDQGQPHTAVARSLTNLLLQNSIEEAVALARRYYLAAGWKTFHVSTHELSVDTARLAATLLIPVDADQLGERVFNHWIIREQPSS